MEPLQHKTDENSPIVKHAENGRNPFKPTGAFIGASWIALLAGVVVIALAYGMPVCS
jgi:hypothetical protein